MSVKSDLNSISYCIKWKYFFDIIVSRRFPIRRRHFQLGDNYVFCLVPGLFPFNKRLIIQRWLLQLSIITNTKWQGHPENQLRRLSSSHPSYTHSHTQTYIHSTHILHKHTLTHKLTYTQLTSFIITHSHINLHTLNSHP